jgi:hypothetical protein
MRLTALVITATLLAAVPASGQEPPPEQPPPEQHPYGLDPYKPSDAALLRDYGVTLVSQTPLAELRKLDPYKPSHAALLRQLGGGIPLWGWAWYASPGPAPLTPFPTAGGMSLPADTVRGNLTRQERTRADGSGLEPEAAGPRPATSMATLRKPESNDGVWILFGQQKWISAGPPVPFEDSAFQRIGEYGAFPVFRRIRASGEIIYVPTRKGLMAPFRLKQ